MSYSKRMCVNPWLPKCVSLWAWGPSKEAAAEQKFQIQIPLSDCWASGCWAVGPLPPSLWVINRQSREFPVSSPGNAPCEAESRLITPHHFTFYVYTFSWFIEPSWYRAGFGAEEGKQCRGFEIGELIGGLWNHPSWLCQCCCLLAPYPTRL